MSLDKVPFRFFVVASLGFLASFPAQGHSSLTVTEMYSHLHPEHLHGTVNKITVSMN